MSDRSHEQQTPDLREAECPWCHNTMSPWLNVPGDWQRPDDPAVYSLHWCRDCCYGQMHPRPEPKAIPSFYSFESYYTHDKTAPREEMRSLIDRARNKLAWMNDRGAPADVPWLRKHLPSNAKSCDIGCGSGVFLERLCTLGHTVVGVEPDPAARAVVQSKGHRVFAGTAEDLPEEVRSERYDCIVMSHVLEHCLDPRHAIRNARDLLAEGGLLLIEVPNNEANGLKRSGIFWPWLDVPRHLNFFTKRSLESVCKESGLSVQAVDFTGYARQFSPSWIGCERRIRSVFFEKTDCSAKPTKTSNPWVLLCSTALAPSRFKYDSVRVLARRSG